MTQIQSNKQDIGQMQKKLKLDITEYRSNEAVQNRITARWTNDEVMIAIQGNMSILLVTLCMQFLSIIIKTA